MSSLPYLLQAPPASARWAPLRPDALVFDMDGLLLDTESLIRRAQLQVGEQMGLDLPDSFCHLMVGLPAEECWRLWSDRFGHQVSADAFFGAASQRLEALIEAGLLRLKPGVSGLLADLEAANLPFAVATSASRVKAMHHLQCAGIAHRFQSIVTRDDVVRGKPHPDLFLRAALHLQCTPSQCLALEPSYHGVRAARAAGMPVIMVPDLLPSTGEMRRFAYRVVDSLDEVGPLLSMDRSTRGAGTPGR